MNIENIRHELQARASKGDYNEQNLFYDLNGNIIALTRKGFMQGGNNNMDQLIYHYTAGTNKLRRVADAIGSNPYTEDIKNQTDDNNYVYNKLGQLIQDKEEYNRQYTYNARGLLQTESHTLVHNGKSYAPTVTLYYDAQGYRTKKVEQRANTAGAANTYLTYTTYYLNDIAGNPVAIYEGTTREVPLYGTTRIGVAHFEGSNADYSYELSDHLGNVRVVLPRNYNGSNYLYATAYYPFGMSMPGATHNYGSGYRWGYQGQYAERDSETGLSAFMLRQYDGRIGRWTTRDVARQFHSPYLAMANNPVAFVDEDGGVARMILKALWGGIKEGGLELVKQYAMHNINPSPDNRINFYLVGWEATEGALKNLLKASNPLAIGKGTKEIVNDIIDVHGALVSGYNAIIHHKNENPMSSSNSFVSIFLAHSIVEYSFDKLGDYMGGSFSKDLKSELVKSLTSTISSQLANFSGKLLQNIMNVITQGYYEVQVGNQNQQWWDNYKKTFGHGQ